jgi:hypothetical protein
MQAFAIRKHFQDEEHGLDNVPEQFALVTGSKACANTQAVSNTVGVVATHEHQTGPNVMPHCCGAQNIVMQLLQCALGVPQTVLTICPCC